MYSNFCYSFRPCAATYVSMFVLSKHKRERKYQLCYGEETAVVSVASASVQENHGLNVKANTRLFQASSVVKKRDSIGSYMDHATTSCSTTFRNDDICTAAELIVGVSRKCSKRFAEKLSKFLCRMRLASASFKDQPHSFEACQKVLNDESSKTISCTNMRLKTVWSMENSGKEEQHTFYMREPSKVFGTRMRLALEHQVFTVPHS